MRDTPADYDARKLSFGVEAAAYARYRPTYPLAAVLWMLQAAGPEASQVIDVGAGTGALSAVLTAAGCDVTAVEPDAGMREQLQRALPDVRALAGSAESVPVSAGAADAVTVGQAWHWFDQPAASAEFARVLRPGGVIGLLWNLRDDSVPWMGELSEIIGGEDTLRASREERNVAPALSEHFQTVERALFTQVVPHTPETLVGLVSTFSYVRLSPHRDEVLAQVRELARTHADLAGRESFELSYLTVAYRAVRR